jgi:tRNA-dihydrouridine synthase B
LYIYLLKTFCSAGVKKIAFYVLYYLVILMKPIGTFLPKNPFFLAPMEAVNCASFRVLCKELGAGVVYTDMIDADIFFEYATEHSLSRAIQKFINPQPDEMPLAIQIGGSKIESLLFTLQAIEPHAVFVDINAGCPLGYMLGKKGGAYFAKHPNMLYKVVKDLLAVATKPLTVKIRSGWDEQSINALEVALELEKLGVSAITIHPRTRVQEGRGKADWQIARHLASNLAIPVILSGDVTNAYTARLAFEKTGCDYIMLARAAQRNPGVFSKLETWWQTKSHLSKPLSRYDKNKEHITKNFKRFVQLYRERETKYSFSQLQDHALWFAKECKNNTVVTQKILRAKREEELVSILSSLIF